MLLLLKSLAREIRQMIHHIYQPTARRRERVRVEPKRPDTAGELPKPGDFRTLDYLGKPILVVRNPEGVVQTFFNACPHRGADLAFARHEGDGLRHECRRRKGCHDQRRRIRVSKS